MVLKIIDATQAKPGATILLDDEAYTVRSQDISKSGKHGASKCRIEAIAIFSGKKKILAVPGSERFDVPNVEKKRVQIMSVNGDMASVMDLESYESYDVQVQSEVREEAAADKQAEVWDIEGKKMLMRVL